MRRNSREIAKHVSSSLQLAILLEVSAHKPGNVNRTADFQSTHYEHFLASAVAVDPSFAWAAERGIMVSGKKIELNDIHLGEIIKNAVVDIEAWLSPIAAAAGMTLVEREALSLSKLRENIKLVVESTKPQDAVAVYEAINIANPSGLVDKAPVLDVNDPKSKRKILEEKTTLYDVFKISAPYDTISKEWVENYPITFETGLPYFTQQLKKTRNLNTAIVHTFLKVLSTVPDTLIARKVSVGKAEEVSKKAGEVLKLGGLATYLGKKELSDLDKELREPANQLNPGTTADIIAAVLAITILEGYRP